MANGSAYEFGAAFGLLTAILEDAADLAVDGQSSKLPWLQRRRLILGIERGLERAVQKVEEIKNNLGREGPPTPPENRS